MANAGIYAQFAQPVRSVGDYLGDMDRREGNALELAMKRLQQRTTERGMADEDTARRIFSQYGDKARNPLMEAGLAKHAFALDDRDMAANKSRADVEKARVDADKGRQEIDSKKLADAKTRIELAGSAFKFVMDNPDPENAVRAAEYLRQNGVFSDEQAKGAIQDVMANPTPDNVKQLATLAYQSALSAEKQLSQYFNQNRGGSFAVAGVNPVTGASADVQSAPITQSADNAATQAQSDKNNQRTVGASLQNAAATRAMAQAQNNQTSAWQNQMRDLQLDKLQSDKEVRDRAKQASIDSVNAQLTVIDKALDHPGRETATGLSGVLDPRNYIAGTQPRNFQVVLDQINGTAFLQAFESLKGGGQITNVEGQKGTDAIARLNRAQSDDEFEVALQDLRGVMEKGYERLTGQAAPQRKPKGGGKPPAAGGFSDAEKERRYQEWKAKQK
jgi:hypothetical protein